MAMRAPALAIPWKATGQLPGLPSSGILRTGSDDLPNCIGAGNASKCDRMACCLVTSSGNGEFIVESSFMGYKSTLKSRRHGCVAQNGVSKRNVSCAAKVPKKSVHQKSKDVEGFQKTISHDGQESKADFIEENVVSDRMGDEKAKPETVDVKHENQLEQEEWGAKQTATGMHKVQEEEEERKKRDELGRQKEAVLKRKKEEELARQKELALALEKEKAEMEARKREIIRLADISQLAKEKVFFYPEVARAGNEIEIFLNRRLSALANRDNVQIMGAFNNWKWESFVVKLQKCNIQGDWWSCKLSIPKEAYKLDFVFFDGENVYENNSMKDFSVLVDGGMTEEDFEDFLIEEKSKQAQKLALEQAERDRITAEKRKIAEEKAAEQVDRAEAKRLANEQRERTQAAFQKAVTHADGLWRIEPLSFTASDTIKLFYNRSFRPLSSSSEVWIHGGYNNWQEMVSIVKKLSPTVSEGGDWWSVEVTVPQNAFILDWVFADGPPERAAVYDNNAYQDFHALVPMSVPEEQYWAEVEDKLFKSLQEERRKRDEAIQRKAELKLRAKAILKEKTQKRFLQSQSHIFYTDPVDIKAGSDVCLFYNPSNTVLNGRQEVWLRCSFNRWTHRRGCLAPLKMEPVKNSSHMKATVKVPKDAYMMDFVFSERGNEHGGLYDNRGGLDYHIPVIGGIVKEPPMNIVHIAVEMAPIAKVGGLGDVVTSLSRAVQELGHNVEVIVPKYDCLKYNYVHDLEERQAFYWRSTRIRVWHGKVEGLTVHFIEPENGMFWAGCVYGRRDDGARFDFFSGAALEFLLQSGRHPDIIHCHDWSTAPVAWLFQESYHKLGLSNARIVFTIHNLEFGAPLIGKAMANADKATTVSYTYAQEISGNPLISPHLHKFHGIINGIDPEIWDPFDDPFIPLCYSADQVIEGKRAAKQELQRRLGLGQQDSPLVGIITRLTAQKGIHLIKHAIWRTMDRSGQVVLLGSAPDPRIQNEFVNLANQLSHDNKAKLWLTYDEPLSHLIYAASDFILVPSIFEPCGLTQLTAMRYGAIPVVRKTGGLNDTVFDVDHDVRRAQEQGLEPNGFSFEGTDASGVDYALNRAITAWYERRDWLNTLAKTVMEQDWTWNRPALDYMELYYAARK